jgi:hypothetical protein
MNDKLFVALTWGLLCAGWAFTVLNGAAAIEQNALTQLKRHRQHYEKRGAIFFDNAPDVPMEVKDHQLRPVPRPTWPRWIAKPVYEAAGFADSYPYWTTITGVGIVAWMRLYCGRVKSRRSRPRGDTIVDVQFSTSREPFRGLPNKAK